MDDTEKSEKLIRDGAELFGDAGAATIGSVTGFLISGPLGAAAGAVAGSIFSKVTKKVLADIVDKILSSRERVRIGGAAYFAGVRIKALLDAGNQPRKDGFFDHNESGRSSAEEIFEGALLKCKNEHEEKKTKYLANIFANASFMPEVAPDAANYNLRMGEVLTYQQLCLIALIHRQDEIGADLTEYWRGGWENADAGNYQVLRKQLYDLGSEGHLLIDFSRSPNFRERPCLTTLGLGLYNLMGLDDISNDEINATWEALQEFHPTEFG